MKLVTYKLKVWESGKQDPHQSTCAQLDKNQDWRWNKIKKFLKSKLLSLHDEYILYQNIKYIILWDFYFPFNILLFIIYMTTIDVNFFFSAEGTIHKVPSDKNVQPHSFCGRVINIFTFFLSSINSQEIAIKSCDRLRIFNNSILLLMMHLWLPMSMNHIRNIFIILLIYLFYMLPFVFFFFNFFALI